MEEIIKELKRLNEEVETNLLKLEKWNALTEEEKVLKEYGEKRINILHFYWGYKLRDYKKIFSIDVEKRDYSYVLKITSKGSTKDTDITLVSGYYIEYETKEVICFFSDFEKDGKNLQIGKRCYIPLEKFKILKHVLDEVRETEEVKQIDNLYELFN